MERSPAEAAPPSPDWLIRPFEVSKLAPAWLGLGVAIAWMGVVAAVHAAADVLIGPAALPFGWVQLAWDTAVNGTLVGLLLAGHAHLHLGAGADLRTLRPLLPGGNAEYERLTRDLPELTPPVRRGVTLLGVLGGVAVATLDPALRDLYRQVPVADPRYILFVLQNVVMGVLGSRLFAAEVHMTRAYARLGREVEIDIFDPSRLLVFARKGLRSVVIWVLISSAFSMFWVLDSAGKANVVFPVGVLALVTVALVAPTRGVHLRLAAAKAAELARVTDAIRTERAATLAPRRADAPPEDARLSNLVQYQAFVRSIREWPFDLSIVARTLLLVVLGVGSWLGGAIVERLLGLALD